MNCTYEESFAGVSSVCTEENQCSWGEEMTFAELCPFRFFHTSCWYDYLVKHYHQLQGRI